MRLKMTPGCSIKLQQQQVARVIVATATKRAGVRARDTVCLSLTQSTVVWDGRTDGQTDRQTPQPDRAAPRRPSGQICCASCRQSARQLSTTNDRASERARHAASDWLQLLAVRIVDYASSMQVIDGQRALCQVNSAEHF